MSILGSRRSWTVRGGLALAALWGSSLRALEVQHVPIPNAAQGRPVPIEAVVIGTEPVSVLYLFFRQPGGPYRPIQMLGSGSQFSAELPSSEVSLQGVDYYLEVTGVDGSKATFPPVNAPANPLRLSVLPVFANFEIVPVSPRPEEVLEEARPDIVVHFTPGQGGLDRTSVRVLVDGQILTRQAHVTDEYLKVRPSRPLAWGPHSLFVNAKSREGVWQLLELRFFVRAPTKKPVSIRGSATLEASHVDVLKSPADERTMAIPRPPGGRGLAGRLESSGRVGAEAVRVSVRTTPVDRGEQPSPDHYSLELSGGSHSLNLGDTTARLTDFSAPYLRLRGGEAVAELGRFKVQGVGGLARRAIETPQFNTGTYERRVYGGRASLKVLGGEVGAQGIFGQDQLDSLPAGVIARAIEGWMAGMNADFPLPSGFRLTAEGAGSRFIPDLTQPITQPGEAYDAKLEQRLEPFSWHLGFRQVSPDFFSPGGPSVQNDYRGYEAGFTMGFSSWVVRGNGTVYRDNIRDQKPATLKTRLLSVGFGRPAAYERPGFDFTFTDTRQKNDAGGLFPVDSETIAFTLTGSASGPKGGGSASLGYNRFLDYSPQPLASDSEGYTGSLSLFGTLWKTSMGLSGGGNLNRTLRTKTQTGFVYGTANLNRRLFWGLSLQLRGNVNRGSSSAGFLDTLQLGYDAGLGWSRRRLRLNLLVREVDFEDRVFAERSYRERSVSLSTTYSF